MGTTTDPNDTRLTRGTDNSPRPQADAYLVLSETDRAKGFVQPYRDNYRHTVCGTTTSMGSAIAETYARDPWFYGGTYCVTCAMHKQLKEFTWLDGSPMAPHLWPDDVFDRVQTRLKEIDSTKGTE